MEEGDVLGRIGADAAHRRNTPAQQHEQVFFQLVGWRREMAVRVDQAGQEALASGVDFRAVLGDRNHRATASGADAAVLDDDHRIVDRRRARAVDQPGAEDNRGRLGVEGREQQQTKSESRGEHSQRFYQ